MILPLLLLLPLLNPGRAEPPEVMPGSVATVVMELPIAGPVAYHVEATEGIRFVGQLEGETAAGVSRLPLTFNIDRGRAAGLFTAGEVVLDGGADAEVRVPIVVRVKERRGAVLEALAERGTIAIGEQLSVRVLIRNAGNTSDSFEIGYESDPGFTVPGLPLTVSLEPGAETIEFLTIRASERLVTGSSQMVVFHARGAAEVQLSEVRLLVTDAPDMDRLYLPGTVFIGSGDLASGNGVPSFAASFAGDVIEGTRLSLSVRHSSDQVTPVVLQSYLAGAPFRASLAHAGWSLTAGDVALIGSVLTGHASPGSGLQLRGGWGANFLSLTYAESHDFGGGRTVGIRANRDTGLGNVGFRVGTEPGLFGSTQNNHATLTWMLGEGRRHQFEAEGGYITRGSIDALGAEGTYRFRGDSHSAFARFRTVASPSADGALPLDEAQAGLDMSLFGGFRGQASVAATGSYLGMKANSGELNGTTGLSWFSGNVHLTSSLTLGEYENFLGQGTTRVLTGTAMAPIGSWVGELSLQTADRGFGEFSTAALGLRHNAESGWIQAGGSYTIAAASQPNLRADLNGEWSVASVRLRGGAGTSLIDQPTGSTSGWGAVAIPVLRRTELVVGSEYRPWAIGGASWVYSVGIQRRSTIPLPRRDLPRSRGIAFEDLNENGLLDPGEPAVGDVVLRAGSNLTTTTATGEFQIPASGDRLELDVGGRWFIQGPALRAAPGSVNIPLVSPASLRVQLFNDVDQDGTLDDEEHPIADAPVEIRDAEGRVWNEETNGQGEILFKGLRPGSYTVKLFGRPNAAGEREESTRAVTLRAGVINELITAGESPRREIRMSRVASLSSTAP